MRTIVFAFVLLVGSASCGPLDFLGNFGNIGKIESLAGEIVSDVKDLINSLTHIVNKDIPKVGSDAQDIISSFKKTIQNNLQNGGSIASLVKGIQDDIGMIKGEIAPDVQNIIDEIKDAIKNTLEPLGNDLAELFGAVGQLIGIPKPEKKADKLENAVDKLGKSVGRADRAPDAQSPDVVGDAIKNVAGGLNDALSGIFGGGKKNMS